MEYFVTVAEESVWSETRRIGIFKDMVDALSF